MPVKTRDTGSSQLLDPVKKLIMTIPTLNCPSGVTLDSPHQKFFVPMSLCASYSIQLEKQHQVFFPSPVEDEIWCKDELAWVIYGAPHQTHHQHLHPAALQEPHLVIQAELHKAWGKGRVHETHTPLPPQLPASAEADGLL